MGWTDTRLLLSPIMRSHSQNQNPDPSKRMFSKTHNIQTGYYLLGYYQAFGPNQAQPLTTPKPWSKHTDVFRNPNFPSVPDNGLYIHTHDSYLSIISTASFASATDFSLRFSRFKTGVCFLALFIYFSVGVLSIYDSYVVVSERSAMTMQFLWTRVSDPGFIPGSWRLTLGCLSTPFSILIW